jgi:hypothetical protein
MRPAEIPDPEIFETQESFEARLSYENTEFCYRYQVGSSVTNRTVRLRVNVVLCTEFLAQFKLLSSGQTPSQIRDLIDRAKMGFRVPVAIQTPGHRLVLVLMDNLHLVDAPVASNTGNAPVNVG